LRSPAILFLPDAPRETESSAIEIESLWGEHPMR